MSFVYLTVTEHSIAFSSTFKDIILSLYKYLHFIKYIEALDGCEILDMHTDLLRDWILHVL